MYPTDPVIHRPADAAGTTPTDPVAHLLPRAADTIGPHIVGAGFILLPAYLYWPDTNPDQVSRSGPCAHGSSSARLNLRHGHSILLQQHHLPFQGWRPRVDVTPVVHATAGTGALPLSPQAM